MREMDKVSGTFFSKSPADDTMGKCTVSIQRVPALDEVNDGFHFLEIHSLPEKMLWPGMILFGLFILVLAWKMM